jgi:hypothetical protein
MKSANNCIQKTARSAAALSGEFVGAAADAGRSRRKFVLENNTGMIYYHTGGDENGSLKNSDYN